MSVVVIGAGIIGLCSARFLVEEGVRELTVIDSAPGAAQGTSLANGALIHPSSVEPWNSPGILGTLMRDIGREDATVLLRLHAIPSLLAWGWRFWRESTPERFLASARANTALALQSLACMRRLDVQPDAFCGKDGGSLTVMREPAALEEALRWSDKLAAQGLRHQRLGRDELIAREPALAPIARELAGGIHQPDDFAGDCHLFARCLAGQLDALGVRLRWNSTVAEIILAPPGSSRAGKAAQASKGVAGVRLASGDIIPASTVVLASATGSVALAARLGVRLPVRPVKGYSLTYTLPRDTQAPRLPIIDRSLHIALTPLVDPRHRESIRLRVAGTAEFCGEDLRLSAARIGALDRLATQTYPRLRDIANGAPPSPWTGLRPMCADGRPLIGATRIAGLFLNTGHGHLGWTVGAASGYALARLIVGRPVGFAVDAFDPARFGLGQSCAVRSERSQV